MNNNRKLLVLVPAVLMLANMARAEGFDTAAATAHLTTFGTAVTSIAGLVGSLVAVSAGLLIWRKVKGKVGGA